MLDIMLSKLMTSTTVINFIALSAFIVETVGIIILKFMDINSFHQWKYLDFFLSKSIATIIMIRTILFISSLAIFLPKHNIDYELFSVIYYCYCFVFVGSCAWVYAYFKGYLKDNGRVK